MTFEKGCYRESSRSISDEKRSLLKAELSDECAEISKERECCIAKATSASLFNRRRSYSAFSH